MVFLAVAILFLHLRLSPLRAGIAEAESIKRVEALITESVSVALQKEDTPYREIVSLAYKADGGVASLQVDTRRLLVLRTQLLTDMLASLQSRENMQIAIPLSSLIGLNFLPASTAFSLDLRVTKSINAYFSSQFEESGINQTLHSILFTVSVDVLLLIPGGQRTIRVTRNLPIAETLIVGDVPDAYTKIHRLTDDITEGELDDIYDFGASAN